MWIYTKNGFASAVQKQQGGPITVRTRTKADIERFAQFVPGGAKVRATPNRDYQYRFVLSQEDFASLMSTLAYDLDYPNFKDTIRDTLPGHDRIVYGRVYGDTWELGSLY